METSVAILKDGKEVLSNVVLSQINIHKVFGGVVPNASRNHIRYLNDVLDESFK